MNKTVIGFFDDQDQADRARRELELEGISSSHINVYSNSSSDLNMSSSQTGMSQDTSNLSFGERVSNFFRNLGDWNVPEEHSHYYAEGIRRGGYVVSVMGEDMEIERAADILDRCGAVDIDRRGQYYRESGFSTFDMNSAPYNRDQSLQFRQQYTDWEKNRFAGAQSQETIPVVEEKVNIGKRAIEKGRVRIFTRVTETPIEQQVQLRDEHVDVQRRPVDRAVNAADMEAFKEGEIEFRETAEEAVVDKQARVVEEVVVSKQANERTETIRDTARRTDVEVDRSSNSTDRRLSDNDLLKPNDRI